MKFKDITVDIPDEEYRAIDAFSYSLLKTIDDEGPDCLINPKHKKSKAFDFGSLVDVITTNIKDKDKIFFTKAIEKPTASLLILADALLKDELILEIPYEELVSDAKLISKVHDLGLWNKMEDTTILTKIKLPIFYDYIKYSIEAKGKIVLEPELKEAAEHCANVLLTSDLTRSLFIETDDIEVLKQAILFYDYKGRRGKAKLDLIRIDHVNKIIYPFDIKTGTELPSKFQNSFYFFKYYLQVVSYMLAIYSKITTIKEFNDYKIDDFKFVYISKKLPDAPVIYNVPERLLTSFLEGWITAKGEKIKGFDELLEEYIYYKTNNIYNIEKEIIINNGLLNISLI